MRKGQVQKVWAQSYYIDEWELDSCAFNETSAQLLDYNINLNNNNKIFNDQ